MKQLFKKTLITALLPTMVLGFSACTTTSNSNLSNSTHVDGVGWQRASAMNPNTLLNRTVARDKARLVFIRKNDNDSEQTSANIGINNRFQVSLHPGHYTVVESCIGTNNLSANATGFKSNNLAINAESYQLKGGETYFIYVDMDEKGNSALSQITSASAMPLLQNKRYQAHQVSRVVPNCPAPVVVSTPVIITAPPPVVVQPVPVLTERAMIDLKVLFDTDKSIVRPEYFSEVAAVAEFMTKYANTDTVIEGHTDSRASDQYNEALSQRRVDAVREVLINQFGIASDRLRAIGYGESRPVATNDTAEGRQLNRRVVAVVEERPKN